MVTPPPGLGDEVQVPAELQDEYDAFVGEGASTRVSYGFDEMTFAQRRAYAFYSFKHYEDTLLGIALITANDHADEARASVIDISERINSYKEFDDQWIGITIPFEIAGEWGKTERFWEFVVYPTSGARGEMAWLADWIVQNYPEDFIAAYPGPDLLKPAAD